MFNISPSDKTGVFTKCFKSKERLCLCWFYAECLQKKSFDAPLFYVDKGRYEKFLRVSLLRRGWRQLVYCQKGKLELFDRGKLTMGSIVEHVSFFWIRNRGGFPFQLLRSDQFCNHIYNESLLTKKHNLASNIRSYLSRHPEAAPDNLEVELLYIFAFIG